MIDTSRRRLLGGLVSLPLLPMAGCGGPPETTEAGFTVFGQVWTLRFVDTPPEKINAAVHAAESIVEPLYRRLHPWKDSELTRLNRQLARDGEATASAEIRELLRISRPLFEASEGRFDPSIGALIAMWGFHADADEQTPSPPPVAELDAWLEHAPTLDDVHVEDDRLRVSNRRAQLDFNALAEGFAAGRVLDAVADLGVDNCLLDTGGDLFTLGSAGPRSWRLGIRDPRDRSQALGGMMATGRRALCSSGDYERRLRYQGRSWGHIIDPHTARPATTNTGTTVLADHPATADGAATALMLCSPSRAGRLAREVGLDGTLLVTEAGELWRDAGMAAKMVELGAGQDRWQTF
ncbi:MAG: FAD:protein FMN transferase [Pseudomonadota bacterium]